MIFSILLAAAAPSSVDFVYTGDRAGRVQPCGCPKNPMGHIAQQVTFIDQHRASKRAGIYFDLGNLFFEAEQSEEVMREPWARRAAIISRSVARMKLDFLVPGPKDFLAGFDGYKQLVSGAGVPVLASDLRTADGKAAFEGWRIFERGGRRILVVGLAGFQPSGTDLVVDQAAKAVKRAASEAGRHDYLVVASHIDRKAAAALAKAMPSIAAILISDARLHLMAKTEGKVVVVGSSKQGKHLGLLTMTHRRGGPFALGRDGKKLAAALKKTRSRRKRRSLREQLRAFDSGNVAEFKLETMGEERPADDEVSGWVRAYAHFIGKLEAGRSSATKGYDGGGDFAGDQACAACHRKAHDVWRGSRHAAAYQSLEARGQQFDRECIACHSAGWRYPGGFSDPVAIGILKNVQCESCHGPGKHHAASGDKALIERGASGEALCRRCHTKELETGFDLKTYLPKIKHW